MSNINLNYKPPSYCRVFVWSGGCPRQFNCLKKFRDLVVPGGVFCTGIILQIILTPTGFLPNGQSFLIIKGDVT